jgi:polysaccharide export outer membrane protein
MVREYRKHPKLFIRPVVNRRLIPYLTSPIAGLTVSVWIGLTGSLPTMAQQMPSLKPAETTPGNTNPSITNPSETLPPGSGVNNPQTQQFPLRSPAPRIQLEEAYTLGPGDAIQIDIFNVPEYSGANGQYEVLVDGTINMPLIGQMQVEGLSLSEITTMLRLGYQPFLQHPEFLTVKLLAKRALQIGIAGEVRRPGSYNGRHRRPSTNLRPSHSARWRHHPISRYSSDPNPSPSSRQTRSTNHS